MKKATKEKQQMSQFDELLQKAIDTELVGRIIQAAAILTANREWCSESIAKEAFDDYCDHIAARFLNAIDTANKENE